VAELVHARLAGVLAVWLLMPVNANRGAISRSKHDCSALAPDTT